MDLKTPPLEYNIKQLPLKVILSAQLLFLEVLYELSYYLSTSNILNLKRKKRIQFKLYLTLLLKLTDIAIGCEPLF